MPKKSKEYYKALFDNSEWTFESLEEADKLCEEIAKEDLGLDIYTNQYEVVTSEQLLDAMSLIGLPISILSFIFSLGTTEDFSLSLSIFPLAIISSYIFLNLFVLGNALSLNKGSVLGALVTMPLALPVLIVLGKGLIAIQLDINFLSFIFLLLGSLSIIIVVIPVVVSYVIKAHLE